METQVQEEKKKISKRQQRKLTRANRNDRWGQSMSLSRRQRRGNRRNLWARSYGTKAGVVTLAIGDNIIKDNTGSADHWLYGGGSFHCN